MFQLRNPVSWLILVMRIDLSRDYWTWFMMVHSMLFSSWNLVIKMLFWRIPSTICAAVPLLTPSGDGCVEQR